MKKFSIEDNQQVIRINYPDLKCLTSVRKFVPESLFQEDSILKGACDGDGYYKIVELENVNYLKKIPFIPFDKYLLKLNYSELNELLKVSIEHFDTADSMFESACDKYRPLGSSEIDFLKGLNELDQSLLMRFVSLNPSVFSQWEEMIDIYYVLRIEFEYYIDCVSEIHRLKYEEEQVKQLITSNQTSSKEEQGGTKKFSLKSFISDLFK